MVTPPTDAGEGDSERIDWDRRQLLKTGLALGTAPALAGCPDPGSPDDGQSDSGLSYSGVIRDVAGNAVPDATVAAFATVERDDGSHSNRVIASGQSNEDGQFDIPIETADPDEVSLVRHSSRIDVVLLAQYRSPDNTIGTAQSPADTWFGRYSISGSNISGGDPPPVPGVEGEYTIRLRHQVLFNGRVSSLDTTGAVVWRTIDPEDPSAQQLSAEVHGLPFSALPVSAPFNSEARHIPLSDGVLSIQLPDDVPQNVRVDYPSKTNQFFEPKWAAPYRADETNAKWFNVGDADWEQYSVTAAFRDTVDEPFGPPLFEFFAGQAFTPLTDDRRETVIPDGESRFERVDEDIANMFVDIIGGRLGDIGKAISAFKLSKQILSYVDNPFDLPEDSTDGQFLGNAQRPNIDPNTYDTVTASWPAAVGDERPPAVVHRVPVRVSADQEANPQTVNLVGFWRTDAQTDGGARFEHAVDIDFARMSPRPSSNEESDSEEDSDRPRGDDEPAVTGQWTQPFADARNTGYLESGGPTDSPGASWSFRGDEETGVYTGKHYAPVLGEQYLYVCTEAGPLFALDPASGAVEWSFREHQQPEELVPSGLAVGDERVYLSMYETATAGTEGEPAVYGVSTEDGSLEWSYSFPEDPDLTVSRPTLANGTLYAYAETFGDRYRLALDTSDGTELWSGRTDARGLGYRSRAAPPAVASDTVYVHAEGRLWAYDAGTGDEKWTSDRIGWGTNGPVTVADDGTVLTVGESADAKYSLFAYDPSASDGERLLWQSLGEVGPSFTADIPIATSGDIAYVPKQTGQSVYPLRVSDGSKAREEPLLPDEDLSVGHTAISASETTVYVGDTAGAIHAVDSDTGEQRFQLTVEDATLSRAPVVTEQWIFTAGDAVRAWKVP